MSRPPFTGMDELVIDGSGRLQVPGFAAREIARQPLALSSHSRRHLLFTVAGGEDPVVMSGLLGEVTVADLLSFCNMFRKTGVLTVVADGARRELFFQQGEIVFAQSAAAAEDLGEILLELGKIDDETLQRARNLAAGRVSLGKLLVDQRALAAKDLWHATRHQVETIVCNLLATAAGSFFFRLSHPEKEGVVRLSMSTQNLIMEGLQRVDERQLFRRRIPSLDVQVRPTERPAEGLSGGEKKLMELVEEGVRSARELIRRTGMGEFDGLRQLYRLAEQGLLRVEEGTGEEPGGRLGDILTVGNRALVQLSRRILARKPDYLEELRRFLRQMPQPYSFLFRDVGLRPDGALDGAGILANLEGLAEGDKEKLLAEGLNEVVFMACQVARRELGSEEATEVVGTVLEIARRLATMIGRGE